MSLDVEVIDLPHGHSARLVKVPADVAITQIISALELPPPRAVMVLNGGTADLNPVIRKRLDDLFNGLAAVIVEESITVVTGGTKAGIFALFGQALEKRPYPAAPRVGVSITGRGGLARLEPHHSHFVLVEGDKWGAETPVMDGLTAALSTGCPSLAVFASGGRITLTEMWYNVAQGRELVLLAGSGGSTDTVIAARLGRRKATKQVEEIIRTGRLTIFEEHQPPAELARLVRERLLSTPSSL